MTEHKTEHKVESPLKAGNTVGVSTTQGHYIGKVELVTDTEIVLTGASFHRDQDIFDAAMEGKATLLPYREKSAVSINRAHVLDVEAK